MRHPIPKIPSSEITPEQVYLSRRRFMTGLGAVAAGALVAGCGAREAVLQGLGATEGDDLAPSGPPPPGATALPSRPVDELGDRANSFEDITHFNNFYEFTTDKQAVAGMAEGFQTSPWTVQVGGLVHQPKVFGIEDLTGDFAQEERVYRLRCVEGWSMVIPWLGFPVAALLADVEPKAEAKYVRFETLYDPQSLPGQRSRWYRLALRGGLAPGRGHERPGAPGDRPVRQGSPAPERSAATTGRALEVRLQEHQVHREDRPGGRRAPRRCG